MGSGIGESSKAADCFMARWHKDEAETTWLCHAAKDAKSDDKGKTGEKGSGSHTYIAVDEYRNKTVDRVARYRFD